MANRNRDAPGQRNPLTAEEQAVAVSDGLCIVGSVSLTAGVGLLLGIGALLVCAGICCIGMSVAIAARIGGRK